MTDKEPVVEALENCIIQLALAAQNKGNEAVSSAIEGVKALGFATLDSDVQEALLEMATYYGWPDGPEYFASLGKGD